MKAFIFKASLFTLPFFLLYLMSEVLINKNAGDLLRVGYIYNTSEYNANLKKSYSHLPLCYNSVADTPVKQSLGPTILTIGDSFSDQGIFGYQNQLANIDSSLNILHLKKFELHNPLQTLTAIINGDLLDSLKVNYIILQSVERAFTRRSINLSFHDTITYSEMKKEYSLKKNVPKPKLKNRQKFFTDRTIKPFIINLQYLFIDKPDWSLTYKTPTTKNLFTYNKQELLFINEDLFDINLNNDSYHVNRLNATLNKISSLLAARGVKLIVLPAPDKFSLYYPYLVRKENYPVPEFSILFNSTYPKEYIYINSFALLGNMITEHKDIYYYDDTHWSPIAAKAIAAEILLHLN